MNADHGTGRGGGERRGRRVSSTLRRRFALKNTGDCRKEERMQGQLNYFYYKNISISFVLDRHSLLVKYFTLNLLTPSLFNDSQLSVELVQNFFSLHLFLLILI